MVLYKNRSRVRDPAKLKAWFYRVLPRCATRHSWGWLFNSDESEVNRSDRATDAKCPYSAVLILVRPGVLALPRMGWL